MELNELVKVLQSEIKVSTAVPPTCFADFQYKYSHFSVFCMIFQYLANSSIYIVCTKLPKFSIFSIFYQ